MKPRLIFLFVIMFSISAQAQNFWEPLDGPYGDTNSVLIECGNKLAFCMSGPNGFRKLHRINGDMLSLIDNSLINNQNIVLALVSQKDYLWALISGSTPFGYYLSLDSGSTFERYDGPRPFPMAENSKNDLYVSKGSFILKSNDQINWEEILIDSTASLAFNIYVNNNDEILLLRHFSDTVLIKKLDPITYRVLFEKNIPIDKKYYKFFVTKNGDYYYQTDSLLYRSSDEGTTFTVVLDAGPVRKLRDILEMNNMLFIATNQGVMTSADKGATWTDVNSGLNSFDCRSIGKTGDNTLYLGLAGDVVYRSVRYTSVEENTAQDQIVCTPNPATDFIEIDIIRWAPLAKWSQSEQINIINVYGQTVSTPVCSADTPASGGQRIDVSGLPPGMYFVRIGDKVGKFIKL